jgi:hypothetical protein
MGTVGSVTGGKRGRDVKLPAHPLVQRSRMVELYLCFPICLYDIMLNYVQG